MTIQKLDEAVPEIHRSVFGAKGSTVIGKVRPEENISVWPGAILRGDNRSLLAGAATCRKTLLSIPIPGSPRRVGESVTICRSKQI